MTVSCCSLNTACGEVAIVERDGALVAVEFVGEGEPVTSAFRVGARWTDGLASPARRQLVEYLAGRRRIFDLRMTPAGTPFQKQVWRALCTIPFGRTCCYSDIAGRIGRPGAVRAVGGANRRNPIAIVVPCHRVIGRDGALTGYSGGLDRKRWLLGHEGVGLPLPGSLTLSASTPASGTA